MKKEIRFFGQQVIVACDENCNKAWGMNKRPKEQLSDDPNDYAFLSDDELPMAPENPGTYENDQPKPINKIGIPNRWCVRECERGCLFKLGQDIRLPDFSRRLRNIQ